MSFFVPVKSRGDFAYGDGASTNGSISTRCQLQLRPGMPASTGLGQPSPQVAPADRPVRSRLFRSCAKSRFHLASQFQSVISQGPGRRFRGALDSRDRGLPFSVLNRIPLLGKLGLVEPKLTLGQFFDFPLDIDAGGFLNLPYPVQAKSDLCDPGLSSRNLLFPLSVRFFTGCPARCSLLNGLQLRLL